MKNGQTRTITIDATGKPIGRLASRIALLLMGKHQSDYQPSEHAPLRIVVTNILSMKVERKKAEQKRYFRSSGYPGSVRSVTLGELLKQSPQEVLLHAIHGMLPPNRLRKKLLRSVTVTQ